MGGKLGGGGHATEHQSTWKPWQSHPAYERTEQRKKLGLGRRYELSHVDLEMNSFATPNCTDWHSKEKQKQSLDVRGSSLHHLGKTRTSGYPHDSPHAFRHTAFSCVDSSASRSKAQDVRDGQAQQKAHPQKPMAARDRFGHALPSPALPQRACWVSASTSLPSHITWWPLLRSKKREDLENLERSARPKMPRRSRPM